MAWIQKCTSHFRTHSLEMTPEGLEIKLETLTDMLPLLHATQNSPLDLGTRSLIYDIGPWKGENLLAGIESFFHCGKAGPIPLSTTTHNTNPEQTLPTRNMEHFCPYPLTQDDSRRVGNQIGDSYRYAPPSPRNSELPSRPWYKIADL